MNMTSALAIPIVIRKTRQPGNYKALRCTPRRKEDECHREKRYPITPASFEFESLLHWHMLEKLVSKPAINYFGGGA